MSICAISGKGFSHVRLFVTPWTIACQAPLSVGFSRQEYWSGLPFPSPGDLPDPGIEPRSPKLQADTLTSEPSAKPMKLEWVADPFSRRSSWPRDRTGVSYIAGGFFTSWVTREALFSICILYSFKVLFHERLLQDIEYRSLCQTGVWRFEFRF